jgi:hypothetical protein
VTDFHSLRGSFITGLVHSGCNPKTAQMLARHSDVNLTLGVYTYSGTATRAQALAMLPDPAAVAEDRLALRGTGTAGAKEPWQNLDKQTAKTGMNTHRAGRSNAADPEGADSHGSLDSIEDGASGRDPQDGTPAAIRTRDLRFRKPSVETPINRSGIDTSDALHQTAKTQPGQGTRKTDPDLDTVIASWVGLPSAVKAGIVAMVKASEKAR